MSSTSVIAAGTAFGFRVNSLVGSLEDSAAAAGYAAFIYSLTGSTPEIVDLGDNRVRVVMTRDQADILQNWLDSQVAGFLHPRKPAKVEFDLNPALVPWALKFALPAGIGLFLIGLLAGKYIIR